VHVVVDDSHLDVQRGQVGVGAEGVVDALRHLGDTR
jgi:hypothetical protein